MLFNYYDSFAQLLTSTSGGGTVSHTHTTIPAGKVYVINNIYAINKNTNVNILLEAYIDGTTLRLNYQAQTSTIFGVVFKLYNPIVLGPGDYVRVYFFSTVANDFCTSDVTGYEMNIS